MFGRDWFDGLRDGDCDFIEMWRGKVGCCGAGCSCGELFYGSIFHDLLFSVHAGLGRLLCWKQLVFHFSEHNGIFSKQQESCAQPYVSQAKGEKSMRYARLFADTHGESHFDDVEIDYTATDYVQSAAPLDLSDTFPADQFGFMRAPAGWSSDFHVSSARNMFVVLTGEWEVTASDGESRRFGVASTLLVEDTSGRGHSSRVVTDSIAAIVRLENH